MATKKITPAQDVYQLKVTLVGTKPPIWRRLQAPALSLGKLHDVLQIAMGWQNYHLHEFIVGQRRFGTPVAEEPELENENTVVLSAVLQKAGDKMIYTYDFGDEWEHSIVLEKKLPLDPDITYPLCIDGKLACPPEDCGGVFGYHDLLEALADPKTKHHKELLDWIDEDYDPEDFSVEEVNQKILSKTLTWKNHAKLTRPM